MAGSVCMGFFDVPTVERKPWGILGLILNIIPGGVGTIIAGAKTSQTNQIVKGIIQFLLTWTVIVWVWSVIDGVRIFRASSQAAPAPVHVAHTPAPVAAAPKPVAAAPKKAPAKKAAKKAAKK